MGKRLRLAKGLAEGTLTADEKMEAENNPIIVQEAKRLKREASKPIKKKRSK